MSGFSSFCGDVGCFSAPSSALGEGLLSTSCFDGTFCFDDDTLDESLLGFLESDDTEASSSLSPPSLDSSTFFVGLPSGGCDNGDASELGSSFLSLGVNFGNDG